MTVVDQNRIEKAARWLAEQSDPPRPAVPILQHRFGLSAKEACEAIAMARAVSNVKGKE